MEEWKHRVNRPINPDQSSSGVAIQRDGNPEGDLYGEVIVFTGALDLPRAEAANFAARIGCQVTTGVTKKTTILVVGDQDITKLAGHEKSLKHRKAEQLVADGHRLRIIRETDFTALVRSANNEI
jgi:DNA polymerase III subunit epsilon